MWRFLIWTSAVGFAAFALVTYTSTYWLPLVTSQGPTTAGTDILKDVISSVAAIVVGLLAGGASVIVAQSQKRDAENLEITRTRLGFTKDEAERQLAFLEKANETMSSYRDALGALSRGEFRSVEIKGLDRQMALIRDRLKRDGDDLYRMWCQFHQRGFYLQERAEKLNASQDWRQLWNEPDGTKGPPLGQAFGMQAEKVVGLLCAERERIKLSIDEIR